MEQRMTVKEMLRQLRDEKINTWFDLGLFIDKFKEDKPIPTAKFNGTFNDFKNELNKSALAFITFYYSIDGVTIEVDKYSRIFRQLFPHTTIHYIAGEIHPEADEFIQPDVKKFSIEEIKGFDDWTLYKDFFFTKLERGSKEYNALIIKFWEQVLTIVEKLGNYIEKNNIKLLYLINICSNPGNVSLSLATVLVSEYLGIPVLNNSHDYYWEGGNREIDIKNKKAKEGPRDFFFKNSDVGEFFSQIEVLFPWESRSWVSININKRQTQHLIHENGHNPANVAEIGTAVDTQEYINITKREKINTFVQITKILSRYQDKLIAYSVKDVINSSLVDTENPEPILLKLGGKSKVANGFTEENIMFLQPTRIISRKRIETSFNLVKKLFSNKIFINKFKESSKLKLTILVTGPIPLGQYSYFNKLLVHFYEMADEIPQEFHERIHLAFMFSELDKEHFKLKFKDPINIPDLYSIASLILLPSKTEGRGLPIIEAAAAGVPIFCRRYYPENVYSEVIGEHLPEKERLKVIEFSGKEITSKHVDDIILRVLFPHKFIDEIEQNKNVVKTRYSIEALSKNFENIFYQLYLQLKPNNKSIQTVKKALTEYENIVKFTNDDLKSIINDENRQYLPGYGRLAFMIYLKSLIDPSYFRVEQQKIRGRILDFAQKLCVYNPDIEKASQNLIFNFYNAVDNIFNYKKGEVPIRHDHSFSYRHRNKNYYPYQDYTFQELTGLINMMYIQIIKPSHSKQIIQSSHFFIDWNLALSQLTSSYYLAIDDRYKLIEKLKANLPIAYFPGKYIKYELEFFALQPVRARLNLSINDELTEKHITDFNKPIAPIYVFAQKNRLGKWMTVSDITDFLVNGHDRELKLLYDKKIIRIVGSEQYSVGIHFPQIGEKALKILHKIKNQNGFIISVRRNSALMTDIVDIDRFHIGRITNELTANFMGIPIDSGYIQFVPAGLRTTLAYPTPIQTAKDFSETLKSDMFKNLCKEYGEEKIFAILKQDAEKNGSPINLVLQKLQKKDNHKEDVEYSFVSGLHKDGMPWNGVIAKVNLNDNKWGFVIKTSIDKTKKVTSFVKEFNKEQKKKTRIAWNGGYILNAELVGKLGLPESYIGSPLGLLISDNKLVSPPLFNKPALLIYEDGSLDIKRVNSSKGITISDSKKSFELSSENYNLVEPGNNIAYYDLLHVNENIEGNGRIIVRLAGNVIKEVVKTKQNEDVKIIPVGITLSFPESKFPKSWDKVGKKLIIKIKGLNKIQHAVEAGPMLVNKGKNVLNMMREGWKTENSIKTQAARLDFTDMRGPKIAVGIDKQGNLCVLTINGRIRESVGATHIDMADIMLKFDMIKAMGFDPGGSSTLVVDDKTLNISPYNHNYESNIYSLPPEPRAVSNAVLGYIKDE